jgi:hypothetical protein
MTQDKYIARQSARDAEYESAYASWVESMGPEERLLAEKLGVLKPSVARHGNGAAGGDAADSPLMRVGDDPALLPEPEPESEPQAAATAHDAETTHHAIRRVVGEIISHENARLTAECIALVSGLSYTGSSMSEIASRHGVTRAAVSKRCVELTELLDLPPSRAMRSLTARHQYRAARIRTTRSYESNNHPPES